MKCAGRFNKRLNYMEKEGKGAEKPKEPFKHVIILHFS